MKANSEKTKQSKKATRRVLAGVLCGASVLSLVLSLVMPPISQAIANGTQEVAAEEVAADEGTLSKDARNPTGKDAENQNNGDVENDANDDVENEANEDTVAADSTADDAEAESAAQPADDGQSVYQVATVANEGEVPGLQKDKDGYTLLDSDKDLSTYLALAEENKPPMLRLTADISSSESITIRQNTTIDLAGHKLYYPAGDNDTFITVESGALTVEDSVKPSDKTSTDNENNPGRPAAITWDTNNNGTLTYYVTTSMPSEGGLGTTETTTKHVVSGFGAIVAASKSGSVKQVISVADGSTLNLNGGMITTPRPLGNDGHVILSQGAVNISGGYVTNGNGGGWRGGLCVTGANASLVMTNGVIAGNKAASGGGIFANNGATLKLTGGIISGNATYSDSDGHGGGILVSGGSVTVSGGYITNNKYAKFCGHDGWGCHGGAGLAANNGAHVTISGGKITGNYSEEAGGGVDVTNQNQPGMSWLDITGGIIASNVSHRSEGAGIRVGQQVDAMINGTPNSKVYITHNRCMSRFDWGGGGIFVQGNSIAGKEKTAGRLFVYNSYISSNTAGGYGGGVAVCPTGKTLVTNTMGTAIFGNSSAGDEHNFREYNRDDGSGNDGTPHLSAGGAEGTNKTEDRDAYDSETFRTCGHADFFLAATGHTTPVAVVSGKMLGDIDAKYSGSIELNNAITIPANGVAQVKNSIGLASPVRATDKAVTEAVQNNKVTTFITENYSWNHGGGIMSNGELYLGEPADTYVYPSLKLKATKVLKNLQTKKNMKLDTKQFPFSFSVYRKDSNDAKRPSWDGETFNDGSCRRVKFAPNNADGNITFDLSDDLSKQLVDFSKNSLSGTGKIKYSYYLVEDAGNIPGVDYDHAVYEINVTVEYNKTVLMSVPIKNDSNKTKDLSVYNFTIDSVDVTKNHEGLADHLGSVSSTDDYYLITDSGEGSTFTNKYTPSVSWTPKATKVVEGGEMKEFTLQLAKDSKFEDIIGTAVTSGNENKQTHSFLGGNGKEIELTYSLSDIRNSSDPGDSTGGPSKTFKYYVREKNERSTYPHYEFDPSVYELTVVAKDDDAGITTNVTYTQIVDAKGNEIPENMRDPKQYGEDTSAGQSLPTFTNTYSTSLPLSGMSGVTLTYLAGAAVLCAAAAWMHIRRKANAKGGKRRE